MGVPRVGAPENLQPIYEETALLAIITRSIPMKSPEARTPKVIAARDKVLEGHAKRRTWDLEAVREYYDLTNDPTKAEVMVGSGLGILSAKNVKLTQGMICTYRAVFQSSDIRTKTGIFVVDLFQEVSNSPASFVTVRCILASVVLLGLSVTISVVLLGSARLRMVHDGPKTQPANVQATCRYVEIGVVWTY